MRHQVHKEAQRQTASGLTWTHCPCFEHGQTDAGSWPGWPWVQRAGRWVLMLSSFMMWQGSYTPYCRVEPSSCQYESACRKSISSCAIHCLTIRCRKSDVSMHGCSPYIAGLTQTTNPPNAAVAAGPSQRSAAGASGDRGYNKQLATSEPSRTQLQSVAERVRKLFRFSSQKSSEGRALPSAEQVVQAGPKSGDRGARPVHVMHGPGHKGHGPPLEPASVLDYDERSSAATVDRSSILSGGDRSSIFSDRSSVLDRGGCW